MARLAVVAGKARKLHVKKEPAVSRADLSQAPAWVGAYAAALKKLTNQEIESQAEEAISKMAPGLEADEDAWWRMRVLFDELRWRLSGLE